jgi:hypothetical protein
MFDYLEDYLTKYNKENEHDVGKILLQRYNDSALEKPSYLFVRQ